MDREIVEVSRVVALLKDCRVWGGIDDQAAARQDVRVDGVMSGGKWEGQCRTGHDEIICGNRDALKHAIDNGKANVIEAAIEKDVKICNAMAEDEGVRFGKTGNWSVGDHAAYFNECMYKRAEHRKHKK